MSKRCHRRDRCYMPFVFDPLSEVKTLFFKLLSSPYITIIRNSFISVTDSEYRILKKSKIISVMYMTKRNSDSFDLFLSDTKGQTMPSFFDERSKTAMHENRFQAYKNENIFSEKIQNQAKNEEN